MHWRPRHLCFRIAAIVIAISTTRLASAADPVPPNKPAPAEYRRPELVAITWQHSLNPMADGAKHAVWRPDGSLIEGEELEWLRKELKTFNCHQWNYNYELRPLILVFRIDESAQSFQTLMGGLAIGRRFQPSGSASPSTNLFLAKTAIVPRHTEIARWPADVNIEVRVPVCEPEKLQSFVGLPRGDIQLADGVRWYVDKSRGVRFVDGSRQSGFPAGVLEIDDRKADPLTTISPAVLLKNGRFLAEDHVTVIDEAGHVTISVSQPLDVANPIVNGGFLRLRHRMELYEKLPTRLDLKPEDPKPGTAVQAGLR